MVCREDPRTKENRRADALIALVAGQSALVDRAHRKSPGVLTEIPHLMAGSVYRLAGAGGGSAEGVCGGVVVA